MVRPGNSSGDPHDPHDPRAGEMFGDVSMLRRVKLQCRSGLALTVLLSVIVSTRSALAGDDGVNAHLVGQWDGFAQTYADVWADGKTDQVLDYVSQDVRATLELAGACEQQRELRWIARSGSRGLYTMRTLPFALGRRICR